MAVIIDEITAETAPIPAAPAPRDPAPGRQSESLKMDDLRFEMRRDADRSARLRAD